MVSLPYLRVLPLAAIVACLQVLAEARGSPDPELHLSSGDLQADGEAIFCAHASSGRGESCKDQWRYAMALTCGPKCHAAEAKLQSQHALHFAAVAREGCDQRTSASCLTSCVVGDLLSDKMVDMGRMSLEVEEDQGLANALAATVAQKSKHGDRWFVSNMTDPLALVMNATLSDPAVEQARKERLDEFWGNLCQKLHADRSPHGKRLCPQDGAQDAVEVNFDYLDDLKAHDESEKRVKAVLEGAEEAPRNPDRAPVGFLQLSPEDYLAEVAKHTPKRVATRALRKASGLAGKVELLKVKKLMEVAFLREKKRIYQCAHPAMLAKLLAEKH